MLKTMRRALFVTVGLCLGFRAAADTVNVRDFGAVGDGKADDTEAIQKAIYGNAAEIVFPAGTYRVTKTLQFAKKAGADPYPRQRLLRGEGNRAILEWDGEKGGILLRAYGMGHCQFTSLWFRGQTEARLKKDRDDRAGILILLEAATGMGNMINHFSYCQFTAADVGFQCGTSDQFPTNSDISLEHINVHRVGTFFYTRNNQAVDFLFNFLFVCDAKTVFHFERGGNILVNNAQVTDAGMVLRIDGGGRCCATFVLNNVRVEGNSRQARGQLLSATNIEWEQALVRFTGYNDVFWQWCHNSGENRVKPLCEIGPGVNVSFESSAFNSPIAALTGKEGKPASLVLRECTLGFLNPNEAISANTFGYLKVENCFTDHMEPQPDIVKWPALPTMVIPADADYTAPLPPAMPDCDQAMAEALARRQAWVEALRK